MKKLRFVNPGELPERIDRAGESYPAGPSCVLPLPTGAGLISTFPGGAWSTGGNLIKASRCQSVFWHFQCVKSY